MKKALTLIISIFVLILFALSVGAFSCAAYYDDPLESNNMRMPYNIEVSDFLHIRYTSSAYTFNFYLDIDEGYSDDDVQYVYLIYTDNSFTDFPYYDSSSTYNHAFVVNKGYAGRSFCFLVLGDETYRSEWIYVPQEINQYFYSCYNSFSTLYFESNFTSPYTNLSITLDFYKGNQKYSSSTFTPSRSNFIVECSDLVSDDFFVSNSLTDIPSVFVTVNYLNHSFYTTSLFLQSLPDSYYGSNGTVNVPTYQLSDLQTVTDILFKSSRCSCFLVFLSFMEVVSLVLVGSIIWRHL